MTPKGLPHVIVECNFLGVGKALPHTPSAPTVYGWCISSVTALEIVVARRGLRVEISALQFPRLACLIYLRWKRLERSECVGGLWRGFSIVG